MHSVHYEYFLTNAYYLPNWFANSLRTETFLLSVCCPHVYPQLNQNEPDYGSKLGIVNKLNWDTIKKFPTCFNDNCYQGTHILLEILLTGLSGYHEKTNFNSI